MKQKICALALTAALSLTLLITPVLAAEVSFTDTSAHWAREAISAVVEKGLFQGTSADTFSPDVSMTRGMFVTVLGRFAASMGYSISGNSSFTDVSSSAYYASYVAWAADNDIVRGLGDGRFGPDLPVTREQMCTLFLRFLTYIGYQVPSGTTSNFADAEQISQYAVDAVGSAVELGLIQGSPEGDGMVFRPGESASRAEVATVFLRLDSLPDIHSQTPTDPVTPVDPATPSGPVGPVNPPAPVDPGKPDESELSEEDQLKEAEVAGYLTTMLNKYHAMQADRSSYYATTGPEAKACVKQLMECISKALDERANGQLLTKTHIRTTYKDEINAVKAAYHAMTDEQATEFQNIILRTESVPHLQVVLDYFGVKM